ncbi:hypothetical protein GCM10022235_32870 [Kribbella ginsengisoli]|uniref:Uncharacterized protein n=1 Tax=Kribbella ginsengisoli TaxID=363865 RepID=A0ABP6X805_9ACTN
MPSVPVGPKCLSLRWRAANHLNRAPLTRDRSMLLNRVRLGGTCSAVVSNRSNLQSISGKRQ